MPEIATQKISGLRQFYGITEPRALAYFAVHEEADVRHRAAWREWLATQNDVGHVWRSRGDGTHLASSVGCAGCGVSGRLRGEELSRKFGNGRRKAKSAESLKHCQAPSAWALSFV